MQWFYVKDDATTPMIVFFGCIIKEALGSWRWGIPVKERNNVDNLLAALQTLKDRSMKGSGIISTYHARRVAPLMARVLPLHQMVPGVSFEVVQRIKEAMEPSKDNAGVVLDFVYPVLGHPPMWPKPRFIDFVSSLFPCLLFT